MQKTAERTLDSREVAEMVEKEHSKLLRDIHRYENQFNEAKIGLVDFFKGSTYVDGKGEKRPCYLITKKGCEFIAHKLTGMKGTVFTAKYINRFHEMEKELERKTAEPEFPWFIKKFRGETIMLFRDFKSVTGVELSGDYTAVKRQVYLTGGRDYNGWGWYTVIDKEKFKEEYGFDYGDNDCMMYLYTCGIYKALDILLMETDKKNLDKVKEQKKMILDGLQTALLSVGEPERETVPELPDKSIIGTYTIQIARA